VQNKIRNWVVSIPTEEKSLDQVFDPTIDNLILDSIYYNVQFFQIEKAQKAFDFLSGLLSSGKRISDYVNEQNL